MLKIEGYPHAHYDTVTKTGYLAHYYPYPGSMPHEDAMSLDDWRGGSYSPEILNYKEGRDDDIRRFVPPFLQLIVFAAQSEKVGDIFLIPVPSSMANNNPGFSLVPRRKDIKGSRNRDDRNSIFCHFLSIESKKYNIKVADILIRKIDKPEKATWNANQHADSLDIVVLGPTSSSSMAMILIDDVTTVGGTLEGAKLKIQRQFPQVIVICLSIGFTRHPQQFVSLT